MIRRIALSLFLVFSFAFAAAADQPPMAEFAVEQTASEDYYGDYYDYSSYLDCDYDADWEPLEYTDEA